MNVWLLFIWVEFFLLNSSDFVEATRSVFQENLEELGLGEGPFMFSYHEAASLMDTSAFHSPVSNALTISLHTPYQYTYCMHLYIYFF